MFGRGEISFAGIAQNRRSEQLSQPSREDIYAKYFLESEADADVPIYQNMWTEEAMRKQ